jgi:hypothetical protein
VNSMDARIRGAQAQVTALPAPVLDARRTFGERMLKHVRAAFDAKHKWMPSDAVWAQVGELVWGPPPEPHPPLRRSKKGTF